MILTVLPLISPNGSPNLLLPIGGKPPKVADEWICAGDKRSLDKIKSLRVYGRDDGTIAFRRLQGKICSALKKQVNALVRLFINGITDRPKLGYAVRAKTCLQAQFENLGLIPFDSRLPNWLMPLPIFRKEIATAIAQPFHVPAPRGTQNFLSVYRLRHSGIPEFMDQKIPLRKPGSCYPSPDNVLFTTPLACQSAPQVASTACRV